jgi:hypothetical protein
MPPVPLQAVSGGPSEVALSGLFEPGLPPPHAGAPTARIATNSTARRRLLPSGWACDEGMGPIPRSAQGG